LSAIPGVEAMAVADDLPLGPSRRQQVECDRDSQPHALPAICQTLTPEARNRMQTLDPQLPLLGLGTLRERVRRGQPSSGWS